MLDITAGIVTMPTQYILAVSDYTPRLYQGNLREELTYRLQLIDKAYSKTQERLGKQVELLVTGDFNCCDLLWDRNRAVLTYYPFVWQPLPHASKGGFRGSSGIA